MPTKTTTGATAANTPAAGKTKATGKPAVMPPARVAAAAMHLIDPKHRGRPVPDESKRSMHLDYWITDQGEYTNWCWASVSAAISKYYFTRAARGATAEKNPGRRANDRAKPVPRRRRGDVVSGVLSGSCEEDPSSNCMFMKIKPPPTADDIEWFKKNCCRVKHPLQEDWDPCDPDLKDQLNHEAPVECGLTGVNVYSDSKDEAIGPEEIERHIRNHQPIVMGLTWKKGGYRGHYVAITGFAKTDRGTFITIADPMGHWFTFKYNKKLIKPRVTVACATMYWANTYMTKAPPRPLQTKPAQQAD